MKLSGRVGSLKPSPTLALNQKAKALRAAGRSIINLTVGEPDFTTPKRICRAAVNALDRGETKYTPAAGIPDLKGAIAKKVTAEYGRAFEPQQVIVTAGAKHALFNACQALLDPGAEAVIISPYWVSYVDMVRLAGADPVIVAASEDRRFFPDPAAIERALSPRTRLLFLNSPCNPTGATYERPLLEEISRLLRRWPDVVALTDDIYQSLVYDGASFHSIGMCADLPQDQLVIVSGVSKTYAMTGWRIGYALGPKPLITAMESLQSQSTSNASSIAQWAALEAITGDQSDVAEMRNEFERRRDHLLKRIAEIPGVKCVVPGGAFFLFPNIGSFLGKSTPAGRKIATDLDLSDYLLEEWGLAAVPGTDFGVNGYLRLTYSASNADLDEGAARLAKGLQALK